MSVRISRNTQLSKSHQSRWTTIPSRIGPKQARKLKELSDILSSEEQMLHCVRSDLIRHGMNVDEGVEGLTAERVLRILVLQQMNGLSYEDLAFNLEDSRFCQAFCLLSHDDKPSASMLQRIIHCIAAETREQIVRFVSTKKRKRRGKADTKRRVSS